MLDRIPELTHVARPRIGRKRRERRRRQACHAPARRGREIAEDLLREEREIALSLAQRRDPEAHDGDTKEQILPEFPLRDHLAEIAVRGGEDARGERNRPVRADALERTVLQHAEQLRLARHRELADLVEEHRARARGLEGAGARRDSARERAALVAKELALHEVLGDRSAVDHAQCARRPSAALVQQPRDECLPRPALAEEEHRRARRREPGQEARDLHRSRRPPEEGARAAHRLRAQRRVVVLHAGEALGPREARSADARRHGEEPPRLVRDIAAREAHREPGRPAPMDRRDDQGPAPFRVRRLHERLFVPEQGVDRRVPRALSREDEAHLLGPRARRPTGDGQSVALDVQRGVERVRQRDERAEADEVAREPAEDRVHVGRLHVARRRLQDDSQHRVPDDERRVRRQHGLGHLVAADDERLGALAREHAHTFTLEAHLQVPSGDAPIREREARVARPPDDARGAIDRQAQAAIRPLRDDQEQR